MNLLLSNFSLAWRNLWRNRRRSFVTISSLAFGFAAITLFSGYVRAIYNVLGNVSIHSEAIGHLQINKRGLQTEGKLHPAKYLLNEAAIAKISQAVNRAAPNAKIMPRLSVMGLLSNGQASTIFIGRGIAPDDLAAIRGPFRDFPGALSNENPHGITLGEGLANTLKLNLGDSGAILASTIHGQANAADVDVTGAFNTSNLLTNDKLILMPLNMAQDILDAKGRAESLTIMLPVAAPPKHKISLPEAVRMAYQQMPPQEEETNALRSRIMAELKVSGLDQEMEISTWQEMSIFYGQSRAMFDMIFSMMFVVVVSIVVLSIANAMSMSVVERTREIGTLRAIGLRRSGISAMFVCEAVLLVILGTASGVILATLTRYGVNAAEIMWMPPNSTQAVQMYIGFDMLRTVVAGIALAALAVFAAFVPARRAAGNSITESLGHV
ncbi:MAG: FtsX-like permease family protein [Aquabacterium sp.]|nr:FtsX-like permease family protein [Aquabacterium sp.]